MLISQFISYYCWTAHEGAESKALRSCVVQQHNWFRIHTVVLKIIHIYFSVKGYIGKAMLEMNRGAGRGLIPARCVGSHYCWLNLLVRKIQLHLLEKEIWAQRTLEDIFILLVAYAHDKDICDEESLWQICYCESSPESLMKILALLSSLGFLLSAEKTGDEQNLIWVNHSVMGGYIFTWECSRWDLIF